VELRAFNAKDARHVAFHNLFRSLDSKSPKFRELKPADLRILELGAEGSFSLDRIVNQLNCHAFGVGYSLTGCRLAIANTNCKTNVHIVQGDVRTPPFFPAQFHFVYSCGLVEHFSDPRPVLCRAVDLLVPGGLLLTTIPNKVGLAGITERLLSPASFHKHLPLNLNELLNIHHETGCVNVDGIYFGPFSIIDVEPSRNIDRLTLVRLLKRALNKFIFFPLYLKAKIRLNSQWLSSDIAAWGIKPL
jgi:SAM-dependent methyltransferase